MEIVVIGKVDIRPISDKQEAKLVEFVEKVGEFLKVVADDGIKLYNQSMVAYVDDFSHECSTNTVDLFAENGIAIRVSFYEKDGKIVPDANLYHEDRLESMVDLYTKGVSLDYAFREIKQIIEGYEKDMVVFRKIDPTLGN
jgi:hypothetical protein